MSYWLNVLSFQFRYLCWSEKNNTKHTLPKRTHANQLAPSAMWKSCTRDMTLNRCGTKQQLCFECFLVRADVYLNCNLSLCHYHESISVKMSFEDTAPDIIPRKAIEFDVTTTESRLVHVPILVTFYSIKLWQAALSNLLFFSLVHRSWSRKR